MEASRTAKVGAKDWMRDPLSGELKVFDEEYGSYRGGVGIEGKAEWSGKIRLKVIAQNETGLRFFWGAGNGAKGFHLWAPG